MSSPAAVASGWRSSGSEVSRISPSAASKTGAASDNVAHVKQRDLIGPFEQLVLTAIYKLGERAYGMAIHEEVAELGGRHVRLGAVYMTLDRMREKAEAFRDVTVSTTLYV